MDTEKGRNKEDTLKAFSEFFTHLFKHDGFFMSKEVAKETIPIYELMTKHLHDLHVIRTGSTVDGSILFGCDYDKMYIVQNMVAFDEEYATDKGKFNFKIEIYEDLPCYVKLKLWSCPDQPDLDEILTLLEEFSGIHYLSSDKYRKVKIIPRSSEWISSYATRSKTFEHGPCAQMTFRFDNSSELELDITEGIRCTEWPVISQEWIHRNRHWPPQCLVDKVKILPVYVVPVGTLGTPQYSVQWRLSFILIERELLWSFNETQFNCLFILKIIAKFHFQPLSSDLTTYHLKTIIFWLSEECNLEWEPKNLVRLVLCCLEKLRNAISQRVLSHFIVIKQNLFHNKFRSSDQRENIIDKIDYVLNNLIRAVMECEMPFLKEVKEKVLLAEHFMQTEGNRQSLIDLIKDTAEKEVKKDKHFETKRNAFGIMVSMLRQPITGKKLSELLHVLDDKTPEYNDEIILAVKEFAYTRLAMLYHLDYINIKDPSLLYFKGGKFESDVIDTSDPNEATLRLQAARYILENGYLLDNLSGDLYYAMFLLVRNEMENMLEKMNALFEKYILLMYVGMCSDQQGVKVANGTITITKDTPEEFGATVPGPICYDVILTGHDVRVVPDAVKYECELNDYSDGCFYFLYHPAVFAYYLMFEMHFKLGNKQKTLAFLEHLAELVDVVKRNNDGYRALNLLGYCYKRLGLKDKALNVFQTSLKTKNTAHNAAAYHLCLMVLEKD